jgi:long-chain fatty acid transport protein
VTFGANPQDRLLGAPEQPEFDANAQMKVGPIFAPALSAGVTYVPSKYVRFGVSGQTPMIISADGNLTMAMPSSSLFDNAHQNGTAVHMRFVLPAIFRVGIEVRPTNDLRIELSYVREFWSEHQSIDITPINMSIDGVTGMAPQTKIPPLAFPRNFQDSNSFRLGGEYAFKAGGVPLDLRMGGSWETSAVPAGYLSLSSLDFDKLTLAFGGSLHVGKQWRFDGLWAHTFASSVYVDPTIAQIPRINPIKGNAPLEPVNGGWYNASADLLGVGLNYLF